MATPQAPEVVTKKRFNDLEHLVGTTHTRLVQVHDFLEEAFDDVQDDIQALNRTMGRIEQVASKTDACLLSLEETQAVLNMRLDAQFDLMFEVRRLLLQEQRSDDSKRPRSPGATRALPLRKCKRT